jgi:PQQ-like domain
MKKLITIIGVILIALIVVNFQCNDNIVDPPPGNPPGYQEDIPWPSLADSPWPMNHHDPQSTGRSKYVGPLGGEIEWQLNIPGVNSAVGFTDLAIGEDSTIYFGSSYENVSQGQMSYLYAVSISGNIKWKFPLNYPFVNTAPIVASNGTIYIASGDKNLYAIDLNGQLKWKYTANESIFLAGINIDKSGNMYFISNDGKLISLDNQGNLRWQLLPDGGLRSSSEAGITFSPDGKTIYSPGHVGSGSKSLYAISNVGEVLWTFGTNTSLIQPLVDSEGNIYFAYNNPNDSSFYGFVSLNPSGQKRWVYQSSLGLVLPALDKNGNIYFAKGDGVVSLDYDGNLRWEYDNLSPTTALVCDSEGNIYFASSDFVALNNDGTVKYIIAINDFNYSTPALGLNHIFFGSVNNPKILYSMR